MNIMELGAIGELVGGVAVLATLIYLALQVRQTAASGRLAATSAIHENFNYVSSFFAAGSDESIIALEAMSGVEGLTPKQRFRWGSQLYTMYCHFEMVYYLRKQGLIEPDEERRAMALLDWYQAAPGVRAWWHGNIYDDRPLKISRLFSEEFQRFMSRVENTGIESIIGSSVEA